jgi:hypothetical protein
MTQAEQVRPELPTREVISDGKVTQSNVERRS